MPGSNTDREYTSIEVVLVVNWNADLW